MTGKEDLEDLELMYMLGEITEAEWKEATSKPRYNKQKARQTQKDMNSYAS